MIRHDVEQGSAEWHDLRSVIPTASNFDRLITPAKWEPTKGDTRRNFMLQLLSNRIFGLDPAAQFTSSAMEHGREWEPIARAAYEFDRGVTIQDGGFWTDDQQRYGASPDGLIGDDGLVEFKNPASPAVHLANFFDDVSLYAPRRERWTVDVSAGAITGFLRDHWVQVQGQLFVTGRSWCDLVSNFSRLPMVVVRVHRNETFLGLLEAALSEFCTELETTTEFAKTQGWIKPRRPVLVNDGIEEFGVSDADVDAMIDELKKRKEAECRT